MSRVETRMMKDCLNTEAIHKLLRICQRLIAICCCVLMLSSVAGVSFAEASVVIKCAYIGRAAKLLNNIDFDYADPSLYSKNGTLIASWKGTTNTVAYMDPHYSEKICMDKNRNIWILGVEREDAGEYKVVFGAEHERPEVDIIIKDFTECPDFPKEEELTEEQLQECRNNHPDFTKEENLFVKQIGQIRELQNDHTEHIKEYIENLSGKQIEQFRELQNDHTEHIKEYIENLFVKQIRQIRELQNDHTEHIKEYIGNLTGEQIREIRKLLDDHSEHNKGYLDRWILLFLGLLIVTEIIKFILLNWNQIRDGWINMKDWIRKKMNRDSKHQ